MKDQVIVGRKTIRFAGQSFVLSAEFYKKPIESYFRKNTILHKLTLELEKRGYVCFGDLPESLGSILIGYSYLGPERLNEFFKTIKKVSSEKKYCLPEPQPVTSLQSISATKIITYFGESFILNANSNDIPISTLFKSNAILRSIATELGKKGYNYLSDLPEDLNSILINYSYLGPSKMAEFFKTLKKASEEAYDKLPDDTEKKLVFKNTPQDRAKKISFSGRSFIVTGNKSRCPIHKLFEKKTKLHSLALELESQGYKFISDLPENLSLVLSRYSYMGYKNLSLFFETLMKEAEETDSHIKRKTSVGELNGTENLSKTKTSKEVRLNTNMPLKLNDKKDYDTTRNNSRKSDAFQNDVKFQEEIDDLITSILEEK